jgi:hypothetical protein
MQPSLARARGGAPVVPLQHRSARALARPPCGAGAPRAAPLALPARRAAQARAPRRGPAASSKDGELSSSELDAILAKYGAGAPAPGGGKDVPAKKPAAAPQKRPGAAPHAPRRACGGARAAAPPPAPGRRPSPACAHAPLPPTSARSRAARRDGGGQWRVPAAPREHSRLRRRPHPPPARHAVAVPEPRAPAVVAVADARVLPRKLVPPQVRRGQTESRAWRRLPQQQHASAARSAQRAAAGAPTAGCRQPARTACALP